MTDNNDKLPTISLIVGLKNNLSYSKVFYQSLRKFHPTTELIFVSYGSNDGTDEWLDQLDDEYLKYYHDVAPKTLSDTYNKGVSLATSELVAFLHNDMIISSHFVAPLQQAYRPGTVLFYTVVEPPIFAKDVHDWKIIADFGADLETLDAEGFIRFTEERLTDEQLVPHATTDLSFFLCVDREVLLKMGGLDSLFNPMFCEDNDLLFRFTLQNLEMVQVPGALAYHFVSKTSRFSVDYERNSKAIERASSANFYRKWRFGPFSPVKHRYDLAALVHHGAAEDIAAIEPYFAQLYTDIDATDYIRSQQAATDFDLSARIQPIAKLAKHDILVELDMRKVNEQDLERLPYLTEIIHRKIFKKRNLLGRLFFNRKKFSIGRLRFRVRALNPSEFQLIVKK